MYLHLFYVADLQLSNRLVSSLAVTRETARDQTLGKVLQLNQTGWFELYRPRYDNASLPSFMTPTQVWPG